jgi:bacterial/archaeal transporter family protein
MTETPAPALAVERLHAFKTQWFWYSIFCLVCWGPYAICSKLGSAELPPLSMQFLFTLGGIPIALMVLILRRFRLEPSPHGIGYAVLVGILSTIGGTALFAAYGTGANTAMVTVVSGLYPLVTVLLAVTLLRERLTSRQWIGLGFAGAACVLFSF